MTMAIAHRENEKVILDLVREIAAPFDPESATDEFARTLKSYGISRVTGDAYSGHWVRQAFQKRGIDYSLSDLTRSGIYVDFLPKLNAKTVSLLDNARLVNQIAGLERRTSRGGKDLIDHPPNGKDDVANAVAGAVVALSNSVTRSGSMELWAAFAAGTR